MNALDLSFWVRLLGVLALESAIVVGLMFVVERFVKSAHWRCTAWQIAMVLLLALTASELSGFGRAVFSRLLPTRSLRLVAPERVFSSSTVISSVVSEVRPLAVQSAPAPVAPKGPVWWPGLIWILGTALILGRVACAQLLLLFLRFRCWRVADIDLAQRAVGMARRLGIRRPIQFLEVRGINGPVAFGGLRPAVGLPVGFTQKFDPSQQNAMLAHELAHIAGGDPMWYRLADVVSALLWWQPLSWWARRRLHSQSELLADEATVLLENGPIKLAECLVTLGRELSTTRRCAWIGVEGGFQSNLGRRVERLLALKESADFSFPFWRSALLKTTLAVCGVGAVLLAFGGAGAQAISERETWKTSLSRSWQSSAGATVMLAALEKPSLPESVPSEPPVKPAAPVSVVTHEPAVLTNRAEGLLAVNTYFTNVAGVVLINPPVANGVAVPKEPMAPLVERTWTVNPVNFVPNLQSALIAKQLQIQIKVKYIELSNFDPASESLDSPLHRLPMGQSTNAPLEEPMAVSDLRALFHPAGILRLNTCNNPTVTNMLTQEETEALMQKVEQRSGTDVLSSPAVTTLDGRQTRVSMQDMMTIVTGVQTNVFWGTNGKPNLSVGYLTAPLGVGSVMNLVPKLEADGSTITLSVEASVTEFHGYDDPKNISKFAAPGATPLKYTQPFPRFRLSHVAAKGSVIDGQTFMLAGPVYHDTVKVTDKVPVLGDIPLLGSLFRSESKAEIKKHLVVLITPTLIDHFGNRVHLTSK